MIHVSRRKELIGRFPKNSPPRRKITNEAAQKQLSPETFNFGE
jgi:hypothetical protein